MSDMPSCPLCATPTHVTACKVLRWRYLCDAPSHAPQLFDGSAAEYLAMGMRRTAHLAHIERMAVDPGIRAVQHSHHPRRVTPVTDVTEEDE